MGNDFIETSNNFQTQFHKRLFSRTEVIAVFLLIMFLSFPNVVVTHGHSHENNEQPSFKYSREANENFLKKEQHSLDNSHIHPEFENDNSHSMNNFEKPRLQTDPFKIWIHSMLSTLLISVAPYFVLYIIPFDNTESMRPRLKILLAFASGSLLGDAFLHLIPHAIAPHIHADSSHNILHSNAHNHDHQELHSHSHDMTVGLWVLGGIIIFLSVEKLVRLIKNNEGHSHIQKGSPNEIKELKLKSDEKSKSHMSTANNEGNRDVAIAGYLNLAADFAHNFTDGLAIGASYLAGNSIGIVTTVTILLHEVPHEIGDFAILIKAGCSRRKAMSLQLVTAVGALAGTALALLGAESNATASWILPFTAGGFIYIATVSVLPELLEESTKLGQSVKEISALLAGVALMVAIAQIE